jgi:soluble lytic murein transglycosylase-like protein
MKSGMAVAEEPPRLQSGGYMEALLLKLQADVAARKRPRSEVVPLVRTGALVVVAFAFAFELGARSVDTSAGWIARAEARERSASMTAQLDSQLGEIEIQRTQIERLQRAVELSSRYGIAADLAIDIEDIALSEGVDPQLAFELVRVESGFNSRAVSPVGALGLTQLMPATAEILAPGISRQQIFERETNLRLGFRFFDQMLTRYNGDVRLALLAYNRGPTRVDELMAAGVDPGNGYARAILGTRYPAGN